jgi:hypothetical protein
VHVTSLTGAASLVRNTFCNSGCAGRSLLAAAANDARIITNIFFMEPPPGATVAPPGEGVE